MPSWVHASWPLCPRCQGAGDEHEGRGTVTVDTVGPCASCHGSGFLVAPDDYTKPPMRDGGVYFHGVPCDDCAGRGLLGAMLGKDGTAVSVSDPGRATYKGPCRICEGRGRVKPYGWRDPIIGLNNEILDPGTHPDLVPMFDAQRRYQS